MDRSDRAHDILKSSLAHIQRLDLPRDPGGSSLCALDGKVRQSITTIIFVIIQTYLMYSLTFV